LFKISSFFSAERFLLKGAQAMNEDERRMTAFMNRINAGEKVEANDWMPEDYRDLLIKQIHMHGVSEIMGAYPEKEWVPKAPSLRRKLALNAKVQDEIGHGQMLLRLAEDLSRPYGRGREELMDDLLDGRMKFHNVFHMEAPTWADAGVIGFIVDGGAIITQAALLDSSYAPYARMLKRIVAEESFHMQYGESVVLALAEGSQVQRDMLQGAINRWWLPMMFFFGPVTMGKSAERMMAYKIRSKTNEELRQKFINRYVPRILSLGMSIPDPALRQDPVTKTWSFTQPDWAFYSDMVRHNSGPASQSRLALRRQAHTGQQWVREAVNQASVRLTEMPGA
jgi:ring-1,2-phenylacetyl-CoA epoxidase subunit PaaA